METQVLKHNVRWAVSLSNGETFFEGKGKFEDIEGKDSPWNRLISYIGDNKLTITSLVLITADNRTFNLPSLGKNPKFQAFDIDSKPFQYTLERKIAFDHGNNDKKDHFTCAVAYYNVNGLIIKLSLWVDENNTNNCWTLINIEK